MRVQRILLCALLASVSVGATCSPVTFQLEYGVGAFASALSVQQTTDGGFVFAGSYRELSDSSQHPYLVKTDELGNVVWQQIFQGIANDEFHHVEQTPDGGFFLVGHSYSTLLMKTDATGQVSWQASAYVYTATRATDGGYVGVAGQSVTPCPRGDTCATPVISRFDANGNLQSETAVSPTPLTDHEAVVLRETSDALYVVAGTTLRAGSAARNIWWAKLDPSGQVIWQGSLASPNYSSTSDMRLTSDGGLIIAGKECPVAGNCPGGEDGVVVRVGPSGNLSWQRTFGGPFEDVSVSAQQTSDAGFVVASETTPDGSLYQGSLTKLDAAGATVWQRYFSPLGATGNLDFYSIQQTSDGGYVLGGDQETYPTPAGSQAVLIKTDQDGHLSPGP